MPLRQADQERESGLALDQRRDRGSLCCADDEIAFPVVGLPAGFDVGAAVMDRLHVRGLLQRAVAGAARPRRWWDLRPVRRFCDPAGTMRPRETPS